jgi:hypothetical protein
MTWQGPHRALTTREYDMLLEPADESPVVSSIAAYRGELGELRVVDQDVLFDFTAGGVTIGFPTHAGAQVDHGADWVEFDSAYGTFRFEQVSDVPAIVEAAESLPALQLAS